MRDLTSEEIVHVYGAGKAPNGPGRKKRTKIIVRCGCRRRKRNGGGNGGGGNGGGGSDGSGSDGSGSD